MNPLRPEAKPWRELDILVVSPTPTHPQDHGNRKRVYELYAELKRQGARIHFVHYASEHDWRMQRPLRYERQMMETWDSYHVVAPSRPLHEAARGPDHTIDEWADPALTGYIRWAFAARRYDALIVEYTWMSFCFEAVPQGVYKILDTHDVFSGRREVLAATGLDPEFFHTTAPEEAKGLARADLVWAIKDGEQRYFETKLGVKQCMTLLYAEPEKRWWKAPPSNDGWLRAGVIGARNNINRRNLESFLEVALPMFEDYMAPVKIIIAGGCSEDFEEYDHPNLEVLGRVRAVEGFYASVDVICAPMQFSTGLKIKVAEALASGAPVVAHAHAMEGYPADEPLHALPDFRSMALELIKLSFDRSPLPALAAKSAETTRDIQQLVLATLEATRVKLHEAGAGSICIVTPMEAFDDRGLLYDHLYAAIDYLRFAKKVVLYVTGDGAKADPEVFKAHGFDLRVFVDPRLSAKLGEALADDWTPLSLETLLTTRGIRQAYFLSDVSGFPDIHGTTLRKGFVRYDALELAGADARAMIQRLAPFMEVDVVAANATEMALEDLPISAFGQIPFRRRVSFTSFGRRLKESGPWHGILLLARTGDRVAPYVTELCTKLGAPVAVVRVDDPKAIRTVAMPSDGEANIANVAGARLVVDLDTGAAIARVILEGAQRQHVPVIRFARGCKAVGIQAARRPARPATIGKLLRTIALGWTEGPFRNWLIAHAADDLVSATLNDGGWTWLWAELTRTKKPDEPTAAALFG